MKKKSCPIRDTFAVISPYWHIYTGLLITFIACVTWVNRVESATQRVEHLEAQAPVVDEIRFNLKALMNHLNVPYVERAD